MRIIELVRFVKSEYSYDFYPNAFPATAPDNSGIVRIFPAPTTSRQVNRLPCQVLVRASDMTTAESKAYEIYESLRMRTDFYVGPDRVVLCTASQPLFVEKDENNRTVYSVNFEIITEE
ncbi:minor capsid protein [Paludifilum halophilum]|uniref:Minor capsid protein n=1 Tax=Paludifilum halophilum TaxID=1642702 RepID=A0A235BAD1_9BACL|nr:minor capsid protein [Paludifilum halophilum]OYD08545.1 hypothetical protein CHM34_06880 [Paludifilum halophilum]